MELLDILNAAFVNLLQRLQLQVSIVGRFLGYFAWVICEGHLDKAHTGSNIGVSRKLIDAIKGL